jgi:hypothetical protein
MQITYSFTPSEVATILHGLRLIQEQCDGAGDCTAGICEHFQDDEDLTIAEIDALCERINPRDGDAPTWKEWPTPDRTAIGDTPTCEDCGEASCICEEPNERTPDDEFSGDLDGEKL